MMLPMLPRYAGASGWRRLPTIMPPHICSFMRKRSASLSRRIFRTRLRPRRGLNALLLSIKGEVVEFPIERLPPIGRP